MHFHGLIFIHSVHMSTTPIPWAILVTTIVLWF